MDGRPPAADDAVVFTLPDAPDAIRQGRRFVDRAVARIDPELSYDAALVAAELLGNASQHGLPPITVRVVRSDDGVRVEVSDGSRLAPLLAPASTTNMTGRGLTLVSQLSAGWGVRSDGPGKVVWADLLPGQVPPALEPDLSGWEDDATPEPHLHTVVLGDVPTGLLLEAKAHVDNLVREFTLAEAVGKELGDVPAHLRRLIQTVVHGFADARDAIKREAVAAAHRGDAHTRLVLHLPPSAAEAGRAYLAALDEADHYARAARLLTLEAPPEHRLFREWYVGAIVDQLSTTGARRPTTPARPFEYVLVVELRRLTAAQRVAERGARLQGMTAALARARTPEDVANVVVSQGVEALGASGGGLLVPALDGRHLAVPGAVGYGERLVGLLREESVDAELPAATALRTGDPVWLENGQERDRRFPLLRGFEAESAAMCAVPLTVGDSRLGALRFSFSSMKLFDDDERAFVTALAALTAQTLQRTELYEKSRRAALRLQSALLPARLAAEPGWQLAAHYRPAGGLRVGGDFYDVFHAGPRRLVAMIGDVMGRGLEAAAAMGQIRSTLRAYALDDPDPVSVMRRTDAFFAALGLDQLVTVLYAVIDIDTGDTVLCSAGHLPAILREVDGTTSLVDTEVGLPFGVRPDDRTVHNLRLDPGSSLLMYTDGLVERRSQDIDAGIALLQEAVGGLPTLGDETSLASVTSAVEADGGEDDVTLLVVSRGD